MKGYSFLSLACRALGGHKGWPHAWRSPEPRKNYDIIIIGAGGHGLATAYFLAKKTPGQKHCSAGKRLVGRWQHRGAIRRSPARNYFWPQSAAFFDHSLKLYEGLGRELNFNVMLSQRGLLTLAHSVHELEGHPAMGKCNQNQ